nr:glutamate 5-kinase [Acidobacteriota bacterium]
RGGMISKLESARIVLHAGKQVIIANGRAPQVLERIVAGEAVGTHFAQPSASAVDRFQR